MTTMDFALLWFFVQLGFIDNGQDTPSVFTALTSFSSQWTITVIGMGILRRVSVPSSLMGLCMLHLVGIAPTLIVGRVAAGHARLNDTWKESRLSSLHFGNSERAQMSTTGGVTQSINPPDKEINIGNNTSSDRGNMPETKLESA
ncbi:hypothetical protein EDD18DRAFT_1330154 [Armillaria luteobubalina]|uniref:Uncharacterized protein n=1 Tax=Armillaria luteobubalina TaxID=153913 RepID=A0AA39QCB1_9AGAR|nr:hypothetical protein EDD18DRAFT_1330154 [Armillaria luteobubalina]